MTTRLDHGHTSPHHDAPVAHESGGWATPVSTAPGIWECKIGEVHRSLLPRGSDAPMRSAVERAFFELTGVKPAFVFSGWGATLTEGERAVVENRLPSEHYAPGDRAQEIAALRAELARVTKERDELAAGAEQTKLLSEMMWAGLEEEGAVLDAAGIPTKRPLPPPSQNFEALTIADRIRLLAAEVAALRAGAAAVESQRALALDVEESHAIMRRAVEADRDRLRAAVEEAKREIVNDRQLAAYVALTAALSPAPVVHPDDAAVDRFAVAMKAKMAASRAKGRGGWDDPAQCTPDYLARLLLEHAKKGDPVDVGNFAMMLFCRPDAVGALARAAELGEACTFVCPVCAEPVPVAAEREWCIPEQDLTCPSCVAPLAVEIVGENASLEVRGEIEDTPTPPEEARGEECWACAGCGKTCAPDEGAADDLPDHCDDCWCAAQKASE